MNPDLHLSLSTCFMNHVNYSFNIFGLELDDETGQINMYHDPTTTIKYKCWMFSSSIVNGQIICVQKNFCTKVIYIWNAATREYMLLSEHTKELDYTVFYGFGFIVETTLTSQTVWFILLGQAFGET